MRYKKYLAVLMALFAMKARGQDSVQHFEKKVLSKTDIEAVFSLYDQDGNNSAVTGGIGTEKLNVYASSIKINHGFQDYNTFTFNGGADVVTSASTDNIDFVLSSASRTDIRGYANFGYRRQFRGLDLGITIGTGISIESDYLSVPINLGLDYAEESGMRSYKVVLQAYFDDLRWGRLNAQYQRPVRLIYPQELRYRDWFDEYMRRSYNLKFGFTQVLNQRMVLGITPEIQYQQGLLSTPFHRVYFNNGSLMVERLPERRLKIPIGIQWNYFTEFGPVLKVNEQFYSDTWGIVSNAIQVESVFKLTPALSLSPFGRYYLQTGSPYFKPYREHVPDEEFYSSDYDLSKLSSVKAGIGIRYAPYADVSESCQWKDLELRYSYYKRSDGLFAHILSLSVLFSWLRENQRIGE